jgi:cell division protein FtsL
MMSPAAVYRIFQRADGEATSVRSVVIALVVAAALLTTAGVIRVSRQHEVLRLGFELARRSEQLGRLQEDRRRLDLELATLAAPDRIRRLANQLGMAPVSPDRIRVVGPRAPEAATPHPPEAAASRAPEAAPAHAPEPATAARPARNGASAPASESATAAPRVPSNAGPTPGAP